MNSPTLYTLQNDHLTVCISDYGARLLSVRYQGEELLYGPKDIDSMLADECYCGAICGRVANRIAQGQARLSTGRQLHLPINNAGNHLHGGLRGFSHHLWTLEQRSETQLTLKLHSPDGDEGYSGNMVVLATYRLIDNKLELQLEAECDELTLINLTHHAYWNLNQQEDVLEHYLQVEADQYTPMVENIPTGQRADVGETHFDLRSSTLLASRMGEGTELPLGYDDNYCLSPTAVASVELRAGTRKLLLSTDAPGLQVYTGYYLPHAFGGIALEPQGYPDAPNKDDFPSIELAAGARYSRQITWSIS